MSDNVERFLTRLGTFEARWREGALAELSLLDETVAVPSDRSPLGERLRAHLAGRVQDFSDLPLHTRELTDFSLSVYRVAQSVRGGETATYLDIAKRLGKPKAVRAVGGALGKNPFLVVVPCHRILGSGNSMGGFSAPGGERTKRLLLAAEGWGTESLFQEGETERAQEYLSRCSDLGPIIERVGPSALRPLYPGSPFAALARSVLYQQLAGSAARAIENRVKALGSPPFLTALELATLDPALLRNAGVSGPKVTALKGLAEAVISGCLQPETLSLLPDSEVEVEVSKIKGMGPWSARMFLMFHLGRRDVFPVRDLGVRKAFQKLYGLSELPEPEFMIKNAKRWRPYRSLAAWYLWRSLEI